MKYMRTYQVPPDMKEKEKIIGGLLNLNQFFWILIGLAIGAGFFAATFSLIGGIPALIIGVILCLTGMPFAVYKKNGLTLFQYMRYKRIFNRKSHKLPNIRKGVNF